MGPNMIDPSSSHTAGAARIAYLAQKMINGPLAKVEFILYGSFARTYHGQVITIRGESLGGGKVHITQINHVEVDFTGEYSAIIVVQKDVPGVVAWITSCLSDRRVNIAFMRLFRESKGHTAYTIVESDGKLPEEIADTIRQNEHVLDVMVVQM